MIHVLLLSVLPFPYAASTPVAAFVVQAPDDKDVDAKIAALGRDVAKLLELATAYASSSKDEAAKKVYKKILEVDAGNETAHKGLGHQFYDKKWFDSFAELAKYKRDEAAKMKTKGLARWKDDWVPEADLPYLKMEWTKDDKGVWSNPVDVAQEKQIAEWKTAGYQFRGDDNSWIAPADFDKWKAVQWKCGDAWLDMPKANEFHSKIEQAWQLVGERYEVWTTCEWDGGHLARWHADQTYADLVRLFGIEPAKKPHLFVLNSLAQYNQAAGNQPILIETEGISSLHGGYFADAFFDVDAKPPKYLGCGVSYWDRKDPKLVIWGPYFMRWAAAQSFVEGIDPSWNAVADRIADGARGDLAAYSTAFWSEKKIPRWLRYGAASYVERFMKNPEAAAGSDPWTLRTFAFSEIKKAGGLHKLDEIFAFAVDIKDIPGSSRLYHEAGLMVAYLLDGAEKDKELAEKLKAFQTALKSGAKTDVTVTATALQKTIVKHEHDIKKFAGL